MQTKPQTPNSSKKPYHAPRLKVYGSLASLTKSNASSNGMNDPGGSSATKTG